MTKTFGEHPQRATLQTCDHDDHHDSDDIDDDADNKADLHHRHHGEQDTARGCYVACTRGIWSPLVHRLHNHIAQAEE